MRNILSRESRRDFLRLGLLLVAAAVPAALQSSVSPGTFPGGNAGEARSRITVRSARELTRPVLYVDARSETEYRSGHIPGAVWFDGRSLDQSIDLLLDRWTPGDILIVYCSSDSCDASSDLAERLVQAGFTDVQVLEGGWKAWSGR